MTGHVFKRLLLVGALALAPAVHLSAAETVPSITHGSSQSGYIDSTVSEKLPGYVAPPVGCVFFGGCTYSESGGWEGGGGGYGEGTGGVDVDGDGIGDFSDMGAAQASGWSGGTSVNNCCDPSATGPNGETTGGGGGGSGNESGGGDGAANGGSNDNDGGGGPR